MLQIDDAAVLATSLTEKKKKQQSRQIEANPTLLLIHLLQIKDYWALFNVMRRKQNVIFFKIYIFNLKNSLKSCLPVSQQ